MAPFDGLLDAALIRLLRITVTSPLLCGLTRSMMPASPLRVSSLPFTALLILSLSLVLVLSFLPPVLSFPSYLPRDPVTLPYSLGLQSLDDVIAASPYPWVASAYPSQTVDHFGWALSNRTFSQRYLYNRDSWLPPTHPSGPGPVFLYCGNEGPIETFAANTGLMFDLAGEFNALLIFVEHRYYGDSFPFGTANASYANASSLSLLTSEQAIADYAQLVDYMRNDPSFPLCLGNCSSVPVIAFGGSYGGMLAAWLRMKYPHAVGGAIAASAPIWQFTGLTAHPRSTPPSSPKPSVNGMAANVALG